MLSGEQTKATYLSRYLSFQELGLAGLITCLCTGSLAVGTMGMRSELHTGR